MAVIDPSSPVGRCRLIVGDTKDIPYLSDAVYLQALEDFENNIQRASQQCAQFILAVLAFDNHQKFNTIEIYGNQSFQQYLNFLKLIVTNANFSQICPIPYSGAASSLNKHPIIEFLQDFNGNFIECTDSESQATTADPNRTGGW